MQWMTAAAGLTHQEYISPGFLSKGGVLEMAQLWVNLPARHKMMAPRYQAIESKDIPAVSLGEGAGEMFLIAGQYGSETGPALTMSPVNVWHALLGEQPTEISIDEGFNTIIFVRKGSVQICGHSTVFNNEATVILSQSGTRISLAPQAPGTSLLILSGLPLNEPIAARGPFVMNTETELRQAMADFQNGLMD